MQPATTPTVVNTVQTVVATPQVQNSVDVNQYAKSIIEYANGDTNKVTKINNINNLDNYIKNNCAYDCRYFLLEKEDE